MARYIDADKLINNGWHLERHGTSGRLLQSMSIADVTTADVAEVVRCIDCVYWDGYGYSGRCETPTNGMIRDFTNYDDFCSYGKRNG